MKKIVFILSVFITILGISACSEESKVDNQAVEKTELVVGGSSMPYVIIFEKGIKPILEKKGYTFKILNFSSLEVNNKSVDEGSVDFNLDQHTAYLNVFNKNKGTKLYPLVHTPLIPAAIYSEKYKSLDEAKEGATILIPQDASNTARALRILEKAGVIKIDPKVDPVLITTKDIIENPKNLNIKNIDSVLVARSLNDDDVDFGHMSGGIAYQSKADAKKAVIKEDVIPDLEMVVAINEKNKDTQWAKDVKEAYQSQEFKDFMKEYDKDGLWVFPK